MWYIVYIFQNEQFGFNLPVYVIFHADSLDEANKKCWEADDAWVKTIPGYDAGSFRRLELGTTLNIAKQ